MTHPSGTAYSAPQAGVDPDAARKFFDKDAYGKGSGASSGKTMSIDDPAAVRGAAKQIQESGQKIDALQAKVDFGERAAQSLPGTDIAKACQRLDFDVKRLLKDQGRWPVEIAGQILGAVDQITHQDDTNAGNLNKPAH